MNFFSLKRNVNINSGFMNENKKWFAVYTRPRWEKKVAEILTRKKIENYCPINKVVRQWSDRKKVVYEPLFTSYVFVRISEREITSLKQTHGIINLVHWLGKPAVIHDSEIEVIKRFLNEHINIKLEKTPINVNDRIQILAGPLMDMVGQVLSIKSNSVKVALPSLGYLMFAEVEVANVEVIRHMIPVERNMRYRLSTAQ
jgi:transcription antitermination factor NusG